MTLFKAKEQLEAALKAYNQAHLLRWVHPSQTETAVKLAHAYYRVRCLEERDAKRKQRKQP